MSGEREGNNVLRGENVRGNLCNLNSILKIITAICFTGAARPFRWLRVDGVLTRMAMQHSQT